MNETDLLKLTLIVIDMSIHPVFANPSYLKDFDNTGSMFNVATTHPSYPSFSIDDFCDALSLMCNARIQRVATWSAIGPDEMFNVEDAHGGLSYRPNLLSQPLIRREAVPITSADVDEAFSFYDARMRLSPRVARNLKVSIDRWVKSKSDQSVVDTFIDLGIALESLYLENIGNAGEFSFRFRLHGAWYLGDNANDRQKLLKEFKVLYDMRSKAVHVGEVPLEGSQELVQRGQELCLQSIIKVVRCGRFPNWSQLVLGAGSC